jgi:predicted restriction endonuclease
MKLGGYTYRQTEKLSHNIQNVKMGQRNTARCIHKPSFIFSNQLNYSYANEIKSTGSIPDEVIE